MNELITLKMAGALEALPKLSGVRDKHQYLKSLLQAEIQHREERTAKRRLSQAKFPTDKEWHDIKEDINPQIDFNKIKGHNNGQFIRNRENLCLMGQQGTGKTHSLIALGRELCRQKISVKFDTAANLANQLEEAKASHSLSKLMRALIKPELLIIDELGFIPFSENGARLLFDVFASRYEKGSIAVSTNLSFDKWLQIFGTPELTAALIDRFSHRCHIYSFEGKSARLAAAKQRIKK